ncbi:hypothetical protein [Tsukamurella sp. 1534]|uniref:phage holin n=1 Tax=Tsukamurella sp. 1534 TaxID=1151061 RepID=UPI0011D25589|nr:hypothetical protein [Tsukamurella sp. 1534]
MLFNIKSWADLRAAAYALLPLISTVLVGYSVLDQQKATLWVALVTAVLGPVISAVQARSVSSFRTAFYAVLAAGQALAIGYGLLQDGQLDAWMPLVTFLIGGAAAAPAVANTDTTPASPYARGGQVTYNITSTSSEDAFLRAQQQARACRERRNPAE